MTDSAELQELSVEECWRLATSVGVCRIAWTAPDGPTLVPVNHVVDGHSVWIRTSAYSQLVREVDDARVALLVDEIDTSTQLGWSVQLRGTAEVHYHPDAVPAGIRELDTWAPGAKPYWLQVHVKDVTGRRLVAG